MEGGGGLITKSGFKKGGLNRAFTVQYFTTTIVNRNNATFKGATSRIAQLEKAGKFFQVCHS